LFLHQKPQFHRSILKHYSQDDKSAAKLVAYCSDQAHSSVEKACKLAGIPSTNVRVLPTATTGPNALQMDTRALEEAIAADRQAGLIPFFVSATLGTTATTACDNLAAVGAVCQRANLNRSLPASDGGSGDENSRSVWMHVDAAYAGAALMCEEFDWMRKGLEYADSFNFNPHKWMLVNFDCSAMWVRSRAVLNAAMASKPFEIYNNDASSSGQVIDYKDWQVPLGRRFRAIKLWMVMRTYGVSGLQAHIRRHVHQAKLFDQLVAADSNLEVSWPTRFGLVCFSVKVTTTIEAANQLNLKILDQLNATGDVWLVHAAAGGRNFLRFALCSPQTEERHVREAYQSIVDASSKVQATPSDV
jgi:aromatic-L-amino-acid decarboxylase